MEVTESDRTCFEPFDISMPCPLSLVSSSELTSVDLASVGSETVEVAGVAALLADTSASSLRSASSSFSNFLPNTCTRTNVL
jgi:hypothetical protein